VKVVNYKRIIISCTIPMNVVSLWCLINESMKRVLFCLTIVLLYPVCFGDYNGVCSKEVTETTCSPFCIEGKTWNYMLWYLDNEGQHEEPYSYVVRGDTVIGDISYKKFYRQKNGTEQLAFMMREEGSKVLKLHPNAEEQPFFDFGRDDIGLVHHLVEDEMDTYWMINAIDTIQVNDRLFRRYYCYQAESEEPVTTIEDGEYLQKDYWVEGIGSASSGIEADGLAVQSILPGIYSYFVSCYENGECIFTADDFAKVAYTSQIETVGHLESNSSYDLQGRRLKDKPASGVYIQNGKKRVVK